VAPGQQWINTMAEGSWSLLVTSIVGLQAAAAYPPGVAARLTWMGHRRPRESDG